MVVDLPAPLGPSSPKTVPESAEKLRPSSARMGAFPRPVEYVLTRPSASRAGGVLIAMVASFLVVEAVPPGLRSTIAMDPR